MNIAMKQKSDKDILSMSGKERALNVLAYAFDGLHHAGKWKVHHESNPKFVFIETNKYGALSTFDFNVLTRLVFAAHHWCVRAEVGPSGPGMVKIRLHPRSNRDGTFCERHPSLDEAVSNFNSTL